MKTTLATTRVNKYKIGMIINKNDECLYFQGLTNRFVIECRKIRNGSQKKSFRVNAVAIQIV